VRVEQAMRERLAAILGEPNPEHTARELFDCASHLLHARASLHTAELGLPCTLWTVSADVLTQPRFVGLMPEVDLRASQEPQGAELIAREFTPLLQSLREQHDYARILQALARKHAQQRDAPAAEFLALVAA
ncbi:MAG TPA: hypothetical protein VJR89_17320, partial [Polyangiales bacterium]|nr:hypothetical protein [Polyangiales bacterium]